MDSPLGVELWSSYLWWAREEPLPSHLKKKFECLYKILKFPEMRQYCYLELQPPPLEIEVALCGNLGLVTRTAAG